MRLANGDNAKNTACYFTRYISKVENETLETDINRIFFIVASGITLTNYVIQPSITLGSVLKGFTPYGTTPMELCKIGDYQDYFLHDKTLDKWYWHREVGKVVLDGSQALSKRNTSANNTYTYSMNTPFDYKIKGNVRAFSNYFTSLGIVNGVTEMYSASRYLDVLGIALYYNAVSPTASSVYINSNVELPNWLPTNNTDIYYPLATPTDTEITYQPLIEQLNNLEKAMSYNGQTNISQVNNDASFIISAEAIMSLQNVLDRIELLES